MSEIATVARPYAKAAFDFAVENQAVDKWQVMLAFTAEVARNEQVTELLSGSLASENWLTSLSTFVAIKLMNMLRT